MKAYSTTEFRAHLAQALKMAKTEGIVKVYNNKGDAFIITPSKKTTSPFESVSTIELPNVNPSEILSAIDAAKDRY